jgi:hypothetical protein
VRGWTFWRRKRFLIPLLAVLGWVSWAVTVTQAKTPSSSHIAAIERWADGKACVGDLDLWVREYVQPRDDKIYFAFRDPKVFNLQISGWRKAGIYTPVIADLWRHDYSDERHQRVAFGTYDSKSAKVVEWSCR